MAVRKPHALVDGLLWAMVVAECATICYIFDTDMLLVLAAFIVGVAIAVHVTKTVFAVGGRFVSNRFLAHLGDPLKKAMTMRKFTDQSWQLVIHVSMTIMELAVISDETWWEDTASMWNGNRSDCGSPKQKTLTKALYLAQLAIWIYTAFSCKFLEEVRKDYVVMMSHHVITIALVTGSYAFNFMPVGVLILLIHDATDIPMDLLKMANYLKLEGPRGLFIVEINFAIMLIGWFYLRIYLFPVKLISSWIFEARAACCLPHEATDFSILLPSPGPPMWLPFLLLLCGLYSLHIWWSFLILRLLAKVVTKGAHESAEEEYEGASDSDR
ncbi:Aste57867_21953 [Aphanomyces stellatus]|uniref:Aste57867_21953 protein n=1 Tax=Aphanomyces stellatus TaxID=120398 RepID=A0A485LJK7_9STRA|nr:hypothetical protein As57867_021884 [Aphanomyces stellatus]VFT98621.1 Aste57867_21953 [Aphanomyces stellatus]